MIIRQENENDYKTIRNLVQLAFESAEYKDGDEHIYVDKLRKSENYIPELALVAEENNVIVGHIMFTKMNIQGKSNNYEQLLLSPLCVALINRNKGIGSALINNGFKIAKKMGYTAVFLCGNPNYYNRFGFKETSKFNIFNTENIEQKYVLCCELILDSLKNTQGLIKII